MSKYVYDLGLEPLSWFNSVSVYVCPAVKVTDTDAHDGDDVPEQTLPSGVVVVLVVLLTNVAVAQSFATVLVQIL